MILIGGTDADCDQLLQDFEAARKLKKIPIPLGATGSGAEQIWRTIQQRFRVFYPDTVSLELFEQLKDSSLDNHKLVDAVFSIIQKVREWEARAKYEKFLKTSDAVEIYEMLKSEYQSLSEYELEDIVEEVTGIWVDPESQDHM